MSTGISLVTLHLPAPQALFFRGLFSMPNRLKGLASPKLGSATEGNCPSAASEKTPCLKGFSVFWVNSGNETDRQNYQMWQKPEKIKNFKAPAGRWEANKGYQVG